MFESFFAIHLLILDNQEQIVGLDDKHRLILEPLDRAYMGFYGIKWGNRCVMRDKAKMFIKIWLTNGCWFSTVIIVLNL